ncbi:Phosphotransferase enzyme family [Aspergillus sclerotialis]|uniref:Phosphotransferase enzyme family n=1 Tax=Aspergillus sclerotialis TaxID=2070753 RepID=A0A3A2Z9Y2_9EURO|nr:Phosphotransferase enzyme family [Aspergillus sclerotialis]
MKDQARPVVTYEEILKGKDLCPHRISGHKLLEIGESMILKVGYGVLMGEAEAMCLVRGLTSTPVPKVLNAYMINDIGFILMERVPGVSLEECWEHLPEASQKSITKQLNAYIHQWRNIEASWEGESYQYGPFQLRKEFNEGVVLALKRSRPKGDLVNEEDHLLAKRILASGEHGQDERKIFTHGDLNPSNIIIDGDNMAGIVDWGVAGYSIAAREHFGMRWATNDPSWRDLSSTILPSDEYAFWVEVNYSMTDYTGI